MTKQFIFFFIFLFFLANVSPASLSIAPPKIIVNSTVGETICENITIVSDREITALGSDKWNKNGKSSAISEYKSDSESLGIQIEYPKNIQIENKRKIKVCITPTQKGVHNGAILYKIKDLPLEAGTWIEVNAKGNDLIKITGNAISSKLNFNLAFVVPIILAIILIALYVKLHMKNHKH